MPFIDLNISSGSFVPGDATVTFSAVCPSSLIVGDVVYISGDKTGGFYQVDKVDITSFLKMPAAGIVVQKLTSTSAVIMCSGEVTGTFTGLIPGKTYFINTSSQISTVAPGAPIVGVRFVQSVGYALSSDTLFIDLHSPMIRVAN
jgi:hypothetical protein